MIYTVTFNPSLDYVIQTEELVPGRINRPPMNASTREERETMYQWILSNLGLKSKALVRGRLYRRSP